MIRHALALIVIGFATSVNGLELKPVTKIPVEDYLPRLIRAKWVAFDSSGDRVAVYYSTPLRNTYLAVYQTSTSKLIRSVEVGDSSLAYRMSNAAPFGSKAEWAAYVDADQLRFLPLRDQAAPDLKPIELKTAEFPADRQVHIAPNADTAFVVEVRSKSRGFYIRELDLDPNSKRKPVKCDIPGVGNTILNDVTSIAFDPVKKVLASSLITTDGDHQLKIWAVSDKPESKLAKLPDTAYSLAISPKGTPIAAALGNATVEFFDTATAKPVGKPITLGEFGVTGLAFHPSGKYLACGTNDKAGKPNLYFVDVESGEVLTKLAATKSGVSAICFDSKGERVAAIGGSGTILIYDARPLLKLQKD